jgi:hypothetical protein
MLSKDDCSVFYIRLMAALFAAGAEVPPNFGGHLDSAIFDGVASLSEPLNQKMFSQMVYKVATTLMALAAKRGCCTAILSDDLSMHLRNLYHFVFDSIDEGSARAWWTKVSSSLTQRAEEQATTAAAEKKQENAGEDNGTEGGEGRRDSQLGAADMLTRKICRLCRGVTTARLEALLFNIDEKLQKQLDVERKELDIRRASNAMAREERASRRAGGNTPKGRIKGDLDKDGNKAKQKQPAPSTPAPVANVASAAAASTPVSQAPPSGARAQRERELGRNRFYYFLKAQHEAEWEGDEGHGWKPLQLTQGEQFAVARLTTPTRASRARSERSSHSTLSNLGPDPYNVRFGDTLAAEVGGGGRGSAWSGDRRGGSGRPLFDPKPA